MRDLLGAADEALLCVAFVQEKGVRLLERELEALSRRGGSARLLATKSFDMRSDAGPAL